MTYYKLDIKSFGLCIGIDGAKELLKVRKKYLKITTIKWVCVGVVFDENYSDFFYEKNTPILLFLN